MYSFIYFIYYFKERWEKERERETKRYIDRVRERNAHKWLTGNIVRVRNKPNYESAYEIYCRSQRRGCSLPFILKFTNTKKKERNAHKMANGQDYSCPS